MLHLRDQQQKLDEVKAKKRRKATINAQQAFADIEAIKKAKDIADRVEARAADYEKRRGRAMALATANAMIEKDMEAFCNTWALELPPQGQ
jgi:hypothetical protein